MASRDFGTNILAFAEDIDKWAEDTLKATSAECAETARTLFRRVVGLSPQVGYGEYAVGHFIHNWRIGTAEALVGEIAGNSTYAIKYGEIDQTINNDYFLNNDQVTFTNSVPYVLRVEYTGWPKKDGQGHPPYSPVAKALAELM